MFEKVILTVKHVRLEPLSEKHKDGLCVAIADGQLWNLFFTLVPHIDDIDLFFQKAYAVHTSGEGLVFATIDVATGQVAGSTRFMKASLQNQRVEIGSTFLGKSFQRTRINTEAKHLMLTHAFESLGLKRVEFLTDYFNTPSRDALLRLGAKQEGILRNHMLMPDGRTRDSVLFSIIDNEWPGIKQNLAFKLA